MSRDGAAGTGALFGDIATLPYVAASSGSLGAMRFIYLTQQPLFAAGQWLGVEASLIAGVVGVGILVADSSLPTAAVFAGLNAFPVVRWVRRTLTARSDAGRGVDWYPPGLLIGLGLAVIAAVVLVLGGLDGFVPRHTKRRRSTAALAGIPRALLNCSARSLSFCLA